MRYILCAAVAILILGKSALAQTPQAQSGTKDYLIGPADVLDIKVRYDDSFNTVAFVRPDGKITIKLMADVQAAGLSTMQLIAIAGGLTAYAKKKDIKIFRMEGDTAKPIPFNYESFTDGSTPKQNI